MEMLTPLFGLLLEVGKFINNEKSNELEKRVLRLRNQYAEEMAKGSLRDDALIYSIRRELFDLCDLYSSQLKGQAAKD